MGKDYKEMQRLEIEKLTFPSIDSFHISQSLVSIARKPRQHHRRGHIHGQVSAMFIVRNWALGHLWRV